MKTDTPSSAIGLPAPASDDGAIVASGWTERGRRRSSTSGESLVDGVKNGMHVAGVSVPSISSVHVAGENESSQSPRNDGDDDGPSTLPHGTYDAALPRTLPRVPTGAGAFDPSPPRGAPTGASVFDAPPAVLLSPFAAKEDTEFLKLFRLARREHISSSPRKAAAAHGARNGKSNGYGQSFGDAGGGTGVADASDAAASGGGDYSDRNDGWFHEPSSPLGQLRAADDCLYVLLQACLVGVILRDVVFWHQYST